MHFEIAIIIVKNPNINPGKSEKSARSSPNVQNVPINAFEMLFSFHYDGLNDSERCLKAASVIRG